MPSDPTAEQLDIRRRSRQRLIGAVALALAAVVFVPMLLDPEPRRDRVEPLLAIPPREGAPPLAAVTGAPGPTASPVVTAPAEANPVPTAPAPPPAAAVNASEVRKTVEPRAAEFKSGAARMGASAPEAKQEPPTPKLEGYAVQVGAFKEEARLAQAREKLVAARLPHYAERLGADQGEITRLRAGPFPSREAADKAAARIKGAGLDVRVVTLP